MSAAYYGGDLERHVQIIESLNSVASALDALEGRADTLSDAAYLDECAMRAMEGYLTAVARPLDANLVADIGPAAYMVADRMLAERKQRRERR